VTVCTEYATQTGRCRWWRLSFSAVEKYICKHADGVYSPNELPTCRKNVLRLLKDDLAGFYDNNNNRRAGGVCSYFVKTIVLRLWEDRADESWSDADLLQRYVDALWTTSACLEVRNIEHYFIDGENLLDEKEIPPDKLNEIKEYFLDRLMRYTADTP